MNKKQAVIIVVLLALIVCMGVAATKFQSPLYVNGTDSGNKSAISLNNQKKTSAKADFFTEARLTRDNENNQYLQNLKAMIDDKNVSKEKKSDAESKYLKFSTDVSNEGKIETALKSKGYEDAICQITNDKVSIIIKGKDKVTDQQAREIKNEVVKISKLNQVEISCQQ